MATLARQALSNGPERFDAYEKIALLGPSAAGAETALAMAAMYDSNHGASAALKALTNIGPSALPHLCAASAAAFLPEGDRRHGPLRIHWPLRRELVTAIGRLGEDARDATPMLIHQLEPVIKDGVVVQRPAEQLEDVTITALGQIGGKDAVAALLKRLPENSYSIPAALAETRDPAAISPLLKLYRDREKEKDFDAIHRLFEAIGTIDPKNPLVREVFVESLKMNGTLASRGNEAALVYQSSRFMMQGGNHAEVAAAFADASIGSQAQTAVLNAVEKEILAGDKKSEELLSAAFQNSTHVEIKRAVLEFIIKQGSRAHEFGDIGPVLANRIGHELSQPPKQVTDLELYPRRDYNDLAVSALAVFGRDGLAQLTFVANGAYRLDEDNRNHLGAMTQAITVAGSQDKSVAAEAIRTLQSLAVWVKSDGYSRAPQIDAAIVKLQAV